MDKELAKKIGDGARVARGALRLTQADAAERIGISHAFYARIERGATLPSVPTLSAIAVGLGISADALLGEPSARAATSRDRVAEYGASSSDLRRLIRRLQKASPRTVRLLNLLAAALES